VTEDVRDVLEIDGRRLPIRHLDRVIFPATGMTKAAVLEYYVRIADAMLPHLRDRLLHMHRYPEGVQGPRFWQKDCPEFRPEWVVTAPVWSRDKGTDIHYCVIDGLASLLWSVNIGSLELHTSLHLRGDLHQPTTVAFDLDPGPEVDILRCGEVALLLRDLLGAIGLESCVKTSGSKGLQVYAPLNTAVGYSETKPFARAIAESLEAHAPDRIVSRMTKSLRGGKVLVDWSQNTEHKSMVCVYSVRARERPTVSAPVAWDEVEAAIAAADPARLAFDIDDVLARVERDGDLFADVLRLQQRFDQTWAIPGSASP
jgi:bifunctional non-homologous end joining protein LigD